MLGPASIVGTIIHKTFYTRCNVRAGSQQCSKNCATDPTLLCCASEITEQKKSGSRWLKSLTGLKLCTTTPNNMQQGVERYATCNIQ